MKLARKLLLAFFAFGLTGSAWGHEGHHETPGQIRSQHGGEVKQGKLMNLELVVDGDKLNFYPLAHPNEKLDLAALKLTATSQAPKGKSQALSLTLGKDAFSGQVNFATASRLKVEVKAQYQGKSDSFSFQVEKP